MLVLQCVMCVCMGIMYIQSVTPFKTVVGKIVSRKISTITFISIYFPCIYIYLGAIVCCWKLNKHSSVSGKHTHKIAIYILRQLISIVWMEISETRNWEKQQAVLLFEQACTWLDCIRIWILIRESNLNQFRSDNDRSFEMFLLM